jgi:hypothetical protein
MKRKELAQLVERFKEVLREQKSSKSSDSEEDVTIVEPEMKIFASSSDFKEHQR